VLVPRNTAVDLGDTFVLRGSASADGKYVKLKAKMTRTRLNGEVELVPVATQVTPVFEGGSQGQPITFTQFLQSPDLKTISVEKTAVVPSGGTVILGRWTEPVEMKPLTGSKIPYIKRLFKNAGSAKECEVIVLATTRVIRITEVESAPQPRDVSANTEL